MSEWLDVMLGEIAERRAEREEARKEAERRAVDAQNREPAENAASKPPKK